MSGAFGRRFHFGVEARGYQSYGYQLAGKKVGRVQKMR
jgi:hypothetical protein